MSAREQYAEVLAAHRWSAMLGGCAPPCGWVGDHGEDEQGQHATHVADALAAALPDPERAVRESWVCDSCMGRVYRDQIADMVDGEHVLCKWCDYEDDPRNWQRRADAAEAKVARVEAWHIMAGAKVRMGISCDCHADIRAALDGA